MDIFASSPIIIFLLGQLTLTYSDVSDCKMKRQGYASDSNAMSIGFTFEVDDVSSSIECATLSLQHSNSTVGFLYEKLASVCRGKLEIA